jgi:hypothetical protein
MIADTQTLDRIFSEARHLPPEYRLRLVQRIIQTLVSPSAVQEPQLLRFGEFGSLISLSPRPTVCLPIGIYDT